jgi:hypothetical protein
MCVFVRGCMCVGMGVGMPTVFADKSALTHTYASEGLKYSTIA